MTTSVADVVAASPAGNVPTVHATYVPLPALATRCTETGLPVSPVLVPDRVSTGSESVVKLVGTPEVVLPLTVVLAHA